MALIFKTESFGLNPNAYISFGIEIEFLYLQINCDEAKEKKSIMYRLRPKFS
jgi:hypothetical protein